jgi:translation initiation factor 1A
MVETQPDEFVRVRLPREGEIFGVVTAMMGGSRMRVDCADGKERLCRVPGRIRSRVWINPGDIVLIVPWPVEGDKKADIAWRYTKLQANWLRRKGYIK